MLHSIRATFLLLLIPFVAPPIARAQDDILLSPEEPVTHTMPADAAIQGGGSIEGTTLAVWGTGARASDGVMVPALHLQIVRNGSPVGAPRILHSSKARPNRFVTVVPAASAFVVVWNDRRHNDPGIYARRFDRDGNALGDETRIGEGAILPNGPLSFRALGVPARGQTLVWSDDRKSAPGIYAITLDADGLFTSSERYLGATFRSIDRETPDPILVLQVDKRGYVIHDDGRIDTRIIPTANLTSPFAIDTDFSLAAFAKDSIRFFRSSDDARPFATVPTPWWAEYPTLFVKVSDGLYRIVSVRRDMIDYRYTFTMRHGLVDTLGVRAVKEEAPATFSPTTAPRNGYSYLDLSAWEITRYCGNALTAEIKIINRYGSPSVGDRIQTQIYNFGLNSAGELVGKGDAIDRECMRSDIIPMRRMRADSLSVVELLPDSVKLTSEVSSGISYEDQLQPTISWSDEGPVATWWNRAPAMTLVEMSLITGQISIIDNTKALIHRPSFPPARFAATRLIVSNLSDPNAFPNDTRYHSYRTSGQGWIHRHAQIEFRQMGLEYYERGAGYDPNTELLTVVWDRAGWRHENGVSTLEPKATRIFTIDTASALLFNDTATHPLQLSGRSIIPLRDRKLFVADDTSAVLIDGADSVGRVSFAGGGPELFYRRMLEDRFLRVYYGNVERTEIVIEQYDLDARLLRQRRLQFAAPRRDPFIAQSRSDGSIVLLTAADGVRATALDATLDLLAHDVVISATRGRVEHPAADIRGDSIFLVWEDYRSNVVDIYGRTVAIAALSRSTVDMSDGPSALFSLSPNPASRSVTIEVAGMDTLPARLEIFDMAGGEIRRETFGPSSSGKIEIMLDGLYQGVYMVRMTVGARTSARKLVVR